MFIKIVFYAVFERIFFLIYFQINKDCYESPRWTGKKNGVQGDRESILKNIENVSLKLFMRLDNLLLKIHRISIDASKQ